jgi:UDP-N-acetylmuramyl pentapeptide phosphotransferase/UDP-N-acetylglucosamine-1-phosphate transferase
MNRANDNLVSAVANGAQRATLSEAMRSGERSNQEVVRFWIITMLLVLFGLSTLKLR